VIGEAGTYEAALEQFSAGKRLARLARFVRAPSGGRCDACGSTLPRLLFGLRDAQTDRCFFVGVSCLARLIETGIVARTRYRQCTEVAYQQEMQRRHQEMSISKCEAGSEAAGNSLPEAPTAEPVADASAMDTRSQGRWIRQGGALVLEEPADNADRVLVIVAVSLLSVGQVER
jgi:hypothetical protein